MYFGCVAGVLYNLVPDFVVLVYPFLLGMYPLYCKFYGVVSAR